MFKFLIDFSIFWFVIFSYVFFRNVVDANKNSFFNLFMCLISIVMLIFMFMFWFFNSSMLRTFFWICWRNVYSVNFNETNFIFKIFDFVFKFITTSFSVIFIFAFVFIVNLIMISIVVNNLNEIRFSIRNITINDWKSWLFRIFRACYSFVHYAKTKFLLKI